MRDESSPRISEPTAEDAREHMLAQMAAQGEVCQTFVQEGEITYDCKVEGYVFSSKAKKAIAAFSQKEL